MQEPLFSISEQRITDKIRERTGREISALEVVLTADCAIVRGSTRSFYVWQLAMCACRDLRIDSHGLSVDFQINVIRT
jgi:hypothetical protein